jgi:phosphoribosylanthranilate isomerase
VAACAPDFMGFIFYSGSQRFVGNNFKIPDVPREIKRVGVFVHESTSAILKLATLHQLAFIQLHGGESTIQCKELKGLGLSVIKVFSVGERFDFNTVKEFVPVADYFLFDTKSNTYGGSGKTFDWSLLSNYTENKPFFLSGGLTPLNFKNAMILRNKDLVGLDFNSGLEITPGVKNSVLVKEVVAGLRYGDVNT